MSKIYYEAIAKRLKNPKAIEVNQKLLTAIGCDDYRDFVLMIGNWAESKDFTYQAKLYDPSEGASWQKFLRAFLKDLISD